MKPQRIFILKIGSFIQPEYGDLSSIGLITGEPVNFGKLMLELGYDVYLASDKDHTCELSGLKYFDLDNKHKAYANGVKEDDIVLLWQGGYYDKEHEPLCVRHYQFLKTVQDGKRTERQFFMLTDTRLPLMNFAKYIRENHDFTVAFSQKHGGYLLDEIDIDVSQVIMLSQASKTEKMANDIKNDTFYLKGRYKGNAIMNHKEIRYIPMYLMPLITHSDYNFSNVTKKHDLVFTVQSLEYFDDYRLGRFVNFLMNENSNLCSDFNVAVYGKHNRKAFDTLFSYIETSKSPLLELPNMMSPVKFGEMKNILRNSVANLCISEKPYLEYDLLPNRIFESFATGCIPIIDKDIYQSTTNGIIKDYIDEFVPPVWSADEICMILNEIKENNFRMNSAEIFRKTIVEDYSDILKNILKTNAFDI